VTKVFAVAGRVFRWRKLHCACEGEGKQHGYDDEPSFTLHILHWPFTFVDTVRDPNRGEEGKGQIYMTVNPGGHPRQKRNCTK